MDASVSQVFVTGSYLSAILWSEFSATSQNKSFHPEPLTPSKAYLATLTGAFSSQTNSLAFHADRANTQQEQTDHVERKLNFPQQLHFHLIHSDPLKVTSADKRVQSDRSIQISQYITPKHRLIDRSIRNRCSAVPALNA